MAFHSGWLILQTLSVNMPLEQKFPAEYTYILCTLVAILHSVHVLNWIHMASVECRHHQWPWIFKTSILMWRLPNMIRNLLRIAHLCHFGNSLTQLINAKHRKFIWLEELTKWFHFIHCMLNHSNWLFTFKGQWQGNNYNGVVCQSKDTNFGF